MPGSEDPCVTIVNPREISVMYGYVTGRMTTEIPVMYGSKGINSGIVHDIKDSLRFHLRYCVLDIS